MKAAKKPKTIKTIRKVFEIMHNYFEQNKIDVDKHYWNLFNFIFEDEWTRQVAENFGEVRKMLKENE